MASFIVIRPVSLSSNIIFFKILSIVFNLDIVYDLYRVEKPIGKIRFFPLTYIISDVAILFLAHGRIVPSICLNRTHLCRFC